MPITRGHTHPTLALDVAWLPASARRLTVDWRRPLNLAVGSQGANTRTVNSEPELHVDLR
jgi:hypothetical protein